MAMKQAISKIALCATLSLGMVLSLSSFTLAAKKPAKSVKASMVRTVPALNSGVTPAELKTAAEITPVGASSNNIKVTFDANTGVYPEYIQNYVVNTYPYVCKIPVSMESQSKITIAITDDRPLAGFPAYPEKTGSVCIGWNTSADATEPISATYGSSENFNMYAVWKDATTDTFYLNFNANGGYYNSDSHMDVCNYTYELNTGHSLIESEVVKPVRPGFTFKGWSTSPVDFNQVTLPLEVNQNMQLFAHWENNNGSIKVTWDPKGGTINGSQDTYVDVVPINSTGYIVSPTPIKDKSDFKGWAEVDGEKPISLAIQLSKSLLVCDLTFYASWQGTYQPADTTVTDPSVPADPTGLVKRWPIGLPVATDVYADLYDDGRLVFKGNGNFTTLYAMEQWGSQAYNQSIKKAIFLGNLKPVNIPDIFHGLVNLEEVEFGALDLTNVVDASRMFEGCRSIRYIPMSNMTMSSVKYISSMFKDCSSIVDLQLPDMSYGTLISMDWAFSYLTNLNEVDISKVNTTNVTNMLGAFYADDSLTKIHLSQKFEIPESCIENYDISGKIFYVTKSNIVYTTLTGDYNTSFNQYVKDAFRYDKRSMIYDDTGHIYVVTFDFDYPTGKKHQIIQEIAAGSTAEEPDTPLCDGYEFVNWLYNGSVYDFNKTVKSDMTLTASWKKSASISDNSYTVTFYTGNDIYATETVVGGSKAERPSDPGLRETEKFHHWSTTKNGGPYNFDTAITDNLKLYSVWVKRDDIVVVKLDLNGGEYKDQDTVSYNVVKGTKFKKPSWKPKYKGYRFLGWYEDSEAEDSFAFSEKIKQDTTIYAGWKDKKEEEQERKEKEDAEAEIAAKLAAAEAAAKEAQSTAEATPQGTGLFDSLLSGLVGGGMADNILYDNYGMADNVVSSGSASADTMVPQTGLHSNSANRTLPILALLGGFISIGIFFYNKKYGAKIK